MKTQRLALAGVLIPALALAACDDDEPMMEPDVVNIVATAEDAGSFNTLLTAVSEAGLTTTLEGSGPFTVFAPTDAAFATLPPATLNALLADPDALAEVLLYHVVEGELTSADVASSSFITTVNGQALPIAGSGSALTVAGAGLASVDLAASNGVIHVVDEVLIPSSEDLVEIAQGNASFSTLVSAVVAADLAGALQADGPFTVFAPTDAAFDDLPDGTLEALLADTEALVDVLTYHVVPGRLYSSDIVGSGSVNTLNGQSATISIDGATVRIDGATVTATDIQGTNGVIHVIDEVILPEGLDLGPTLDIVGTAVAAGSFNTLVAAVQAAGLASALQGDGPFTVFAPTDAAFDALPPGTLDALLADPDALAQILLYHVVDGSLESGDVASSSFIPTLNGQALPVDDVEGAATIAGAGLVDVDIAATNGVIHVVDEVLIPSSEDIVEIAQGNPSFSTLVTALGAADLVGALQGDGPFTVFAPTDGAFAALPAGTLDALLADPDALAEVLTYHVVSGRVYSSDVVGLESAETLNGQSISITVDGGTVQVDGATVTATDIQGTNGIIHVIDQVILPEGF